MAQPSSVAQKLGEQYYREYMGIQAEYETRIRRSLLKTSNDLYKVILQSPSNTFSQRMRLAQYATRKKEIDDILRNGWGKITDTTLSGMRQVSRRAVRSMDAYIQLMVSAVGFTEAEAAGSFGSAARASVRNIQARFINDIDLSPRVYFNRALSSGKVDEIVNNGIIEGKSARELAQAARAFVAPDVPGGMNYAAMRLARTEINNAYHTTQTRAFDDNPFVEGVKWNLSGSHPRSDTCDSYAHEDHDGMGAGVFEAGSAPGKPHPQCFCYVTAVTVSPELFVTNLLNGRYNKYMART